jgi:menaquinone-specific isochorismate synthase
MLRGSTKPKTDSKLETKKLLAEKIARLAESSQIHDLKEGSRVFRVDVPVSSTDALSWLSAQKGSMKFYWADREGDLETAVAGQADLVTSDGAIDYENLFHSLDQKLSSTDAEARYYGGVRFDDHRLADAGWRAYGSYRFFLPRFELRLDGGKGYLACNLLSSKGRAFSSSSILAELDAMVFPATEDERRIPRLVRRDDTPDRATWTEDLERALASLKKGALRKIVLARKSSLEFDGRLNPFVLLRSLKGKTKDCFHFCFMPHPKTAFIGASPERLYARQGRALKTEALAGTRPRGNDKQSDEKLANELLQSEKDIREHGFVVDGIREALSPLCQDLQVEDRVELLRLSHSQHLLCAFQARLNEGITDAQLLSRLHPTPAVGGYPTASALPEIGRLESFDRGWYAGPVGWVGRDEAEFCVAIRSGLVEGSRLYLFAGAGIVEGSTAGGEWDEIENKISDFIKIFAGS